MMHRNIRGYLLSTVIAASLLVSAGGPATAAGTTPGSAARTLANTGVNTGLLVVGVLLLAFGGLLALILGRKRG